MSTISDNNKLHSTQFNYHFEIAKVTPHIQEIFSLFKYLIDPVLNLFL